MASDKYIPALRFSWLTPIYDPVLQLTTRENTFKNALVKQSKINNKQRILDLACGTGTLTILLKQTALEADVIGIDGDRKILESARNKADRNGLNIKFDEGFSN